MAASAVPPVALLAAARLCPAWRPAAFGLIAAWAMAFLGTAAVLAARRRSSQAFWWAFWGGMGSRLAVLGGLAAAGGKPSLLLGYAAGLAVLLPWQMRQVPLG